MTEQEQNELRERMAEFRRKHGHRFVTNYAKPIPGLTLYTLCYWTVMGCAAGALISIAILEWVKRS